MKHLIYILITFISTVTMAQGNFEKGMVKAFDLWKAGNTEDAQHMFERIAAAEQDQWLPHYYIAQINSLKSWNETDAQVLKRQLEKAQDHLNIAMAISKDNPELLVLQAHVWTNWVAFDGMTYGMKYSGKITALYHKIIKMAPDNPRVVFSKAEWDMGSAKYFGHDTAPFCADIEKSTKLFATFKPETELHPNWGKERAEEALESCKG
ncbi:M48 family metallopeptidase [Sediminibacter sp. Hel_I_10]|uniref:tetratricopeptide repeat protein n=1 Tax=Sediminibacter sp. Hel_I_10 TaxID=1392490 RepID=UPI00047BCA42|nr:hypothetical protein [Sediminibacter sp. Hel_I_10]